MGARTERRYATHDRPALSVPAQPYSKVHWCWHLTSSPRKQEGEGREREDSPLFLPPSAFLPSLYLSSFSFCLTVEFEISLSIACLIIREREEGGNVEVWWESVWVEKSRRRRGGRQRCRQDGTLTTTCLIWTPLFLGHKLVFIVPAFANWFWLHLRMKTTVIMNWTKLKSNHISWRSASKSLHQLRRMLVWLAWPSLYVTMCVFWNYCDTLFLNSFKWPYLSLCMF